MRAKRESGRVRVYRDGCLVLDVPDREAGRLAADRTVCERMREALSEVVVPAA